MIISFLEQMDVCLLPITNESQIPTFIVASVVSLNQNIIQTLHAEVHGSHCKLLHVVNQIALT